jgi:hypothetical protein
MPDLIKKLDEVIKALGADWASTASLAAALCMSSVISCCGST